MPRFACTGRLAVAAVAVAALCAQQLIVASSATADSVTVTDLAGLTSAFAAGGTVVLGTDISSDAGNSRVIVGTGTSVTLDLNGHNLAASEYDYDNGFAAIAVPDSAGTSLTIEDTTADADGYSAGTLTASSGSGGAAIGGDRNSSGGNVTITSGNVTVSADSSAAIGSGMVDNGSVDVNGGSLTVTGGNVDAYASGYGGAAIGGGTCADGGNYTQTGGQVTVNAGNYEGTGIGGGAGWCDPTTSTSGGTVTVSGGTLNASGSADGAAIGGAYDGNAAIVTVSGGTVTVSNSQGGVGIGNGQGSQGGGSLDVTGGTVNVSPNYYGQRAIGGAGTAPGIPVHIGVAGTLYLAANDAIGAGAGQDWGTLTNEGTLTLEYGTPLTVPAGVTIHNSGRINLRGILGGDGTVDNTGVIAPWDQQGSYVNGDGHTYYYHYFGYASNDGQGPPGVTVTHNSYRLTYDPNGGPDSAPASTVVFARTLDAGERGLPGANPPTGHVFSGWYTAADGGTKVTNSTDLQSMAGDGPATLPLYAHYAVPQQIAFTSAPAAAMVDDSYPVTATGGASGQPVTFSVGSATTNNACTVAASTVTFRHVGTCVLAADQAGVDDAYTAAPTVFSSIAVAKGGQSIVFTSPSSAVRVNEPSQFTVTATGGGSGNPVTFSLDPGTTGPAGDRACTVAGATVTVSHAGVCAIAATQAGTADYLAASGQVLSLGVGKGAQTVTYSTVAPTAAQVRATTYTPQATAAVSGLPVTITVDPATTNGACTITGGVVSLAHRGQCVLAADQAGSADWDAAPTQRQSFTVAGIPQTITFTEDAPTEATVDGSYVPATQGGGSHNPVTLTVDPATTHSACSITDGRVSFDHAGVCLVAARQEGDADYLDGVGLQTFAVEAAEQSIDFAALGPDAKVGGSEALHATGGAPGRDVTVIVDPQTTSDACTVDGGRVSYRHAGLCSLVAHEAGNADYLDARPVTQSTMVGPASQSVAFTSDAPNAAVAGGDPYTVTADGGTSGLPVTFTVDDATTNDACRVVGTTVTPEHAGTCVVAAHQVGDADHLDAPVVTQSFTVSAPALANTFTALPGTATVGSNHMLQAHGPAGVEFAFEAGSGSACTVSGATVSFVHVGRCVVTATQVGASWTAGQTVTVGQAAQAITITSATPAAAAVGGRYTPTATAPAGTVGLTTHGTACSLSGGNVGFDHPGTCVVTFDQTGTADYEPAPQLEQTFVVAAVPSTVTVTTDPARTVHGQAVRPTASITVAHGVAAGTVQFGVDGHDLGPAANVRNGAATGQALTDATGHPLSVGAHTVSARFIPADPDYAAASTTLTHVVDRAGTTVAVRTSATQVVASVAPIAPGSGVAAGTVRFTVGGAPLGTAPLVGGVARLDRAVPAGAARQVAAIYSGNDAFTGSSASTTRRDPSISATVTATPARTGAGWYRGRVTVRFTCAVAGAALTTACPKPVTLDRAGAGQTVTRTVLAADGGADTVVVDGIDIDHTAPSVGLSGARNGGIYRGATPRTRCVAGDRLAGVATCIMSQRFTPIAVGRVVHYRVTATDHAGNRRTATGSYTVLTRYVAESTYRAGAFDVTGGRTYTFVVVGTGSRPRYYNAEVTPRRPATRGSSFHAAGHGRWTLGISMDKAMHNHPSWNVGIKVGKTMTVLRLRVAQTH